MDNSNIANAEPIETVSAIFTHKINISTKMQRFKNVECTDTELLKFKWTEEVKLNEEEVD